MRFSTRIIVFICYVQFVLCLAALLMHGNSVFGANDGSRWDTIWSLINGHGYAIDEAPYETVDKVFREGHFYSSKPALLPPIVAGITFLASKATGLDLVPGSDYWLIRLVLLTVNFLPFTLLLYSYGKWLLCQSLTDFAKIFCLASAAFGTFLTTYCITLNNHTVAAIGVFFSVLLLMGIASGQSTGKSTFFLCGVLTAWGVANELLAWPFWFFIAACLLKIDSSKMLRFFVPGTLIIAAAFFISTCVATGNMVPFYLKRQLYQYPGSYWAQPSGIDATRESKLTYLFNNTLGHHGIWSLSPIFVLAFLGMGSKQTSQPIRAGSTILTMINGVAVLFGTRNYGGACQGARWFMWLIPLWLFCMPACVDELAQTSRGRLIATLALLVSFGSVLYGMIAHAPGPWSTSWIQDCMQNWGLVSY
jgi:hypothetical protein